MTALREGDALFGSVEMGASSDLGINWDDLVGLTDMPRVGTDNPPPERLCDPAVPQWADIGWRQITAQNVLVHGDDKVRALRAAMQDRYTLRPLRFADASIADGDLMVMVVADRCEYARGVLSHSQREYRPSLQWLAADPTIYSADPTPHDFDTTTVLHADISVTNDGTFASPSGRAWTIEMTAVGTTKNPFVQIVANGQIVTWQNVTLTDGQALVVDEFRSSWIGALGLDGTTRSAGGSEFADWPIFAPGESTFRVGCSSGRLTGTLSTRSTS